MVEKTIILTNATVILERYLKKCVILKFYLNLQEKEVYVFTVKFNF